VELWNDPDPNDLEWAAMCFGIQPYDTGDFFNDVLLDNGLTTCDLVDETTLDLVSSGGTSDSCRRSARDFVAAFLNIRGGSEVNLLQEWEDVVTAGANGSDDQNDALDAFHVRWGGFNNPTPDADCPLPRILP
jgi:hypothetical protein